MRCRFPMHAPSGELADGVTMRTLRPDDGARLGELMYLAYRGGVEDQGEPLEWHLANAVEVLSGKATYGAPIWRASLAAFDGSRLAGATVVTDDVDDAETLLAFALVSPDHRRRGLGRELILASASVLTGLGYRDWVLAVPDGNPARRLYDRLGFQVFTPLRRRSKASRTGFRERPIAWSNRARDTT